MGLSSYYRQYDSQNSAELERQKEELRQMAETQKQLVNENADASIKQIEEAGNAEIRTAEHAYDTVINTANVQKLINERQVAERMANLGMTDSGLNRTQQTAVQLSHSNQVNNAMVARQKQVDALALAISQQVGQVNIQRNNDLTNLDLSHQQNLYSLDEQYRANRDSWAASMYNADQQRAAAEYEAWLDYNESIAKSEAEAEEKAEKEKKEKLSAREKLFEKLYDDEISIEKKRGYIRNFYDAYGEDTRVESWEAEYDRDEYDAKRRSAYMANMNNNGGFILDLGTPESPRYDKEKTGDLIWNAYSVGNISETEAAALMRSYGITN